MFDLNFRDERYLPFEGAGAISVWQLELTQDRALRQFDLMHEFPTEWYKFLHPTAGNPESLEIKIRSQHFPYLAQDRAIQFQAFSLFVRTKSSVTSLAAQVDPSTNGVNVYPLNFPPLSKGDFFSATQNGGIAVDLDETQPWIIQLGTKPGKFNSLADGGHPRLYLVAEYTLS